MYPLSGFWGPGVSKIVPFFWQDSTAGKVVFGGKFGTGEHLPKPPFCFLSNLVEGFSYKLHSRTPFLRMAWIHLLRVILSLAWGVAPCCLCHQVWTSDGPNCQSRGPRTTHHPHKRPSSSGGFFGGWWCANCRNLREKGTICTTPSVALTMLIVNLWGWCVDFPV